MSNDELLSSEYNDMVEDSEDVETPASSEELPSETSEQSEEMVEENTETLEESEEIVEESTETSSEVIYQVVDLARVENSLGIITCFVIFFSVFMIGSMVYRLVKDIFY